MTERMTPERRAEIEREATSKGWASVPADDAIDLLAELHAVERERDKYAQKAYDMEREVLASQSALVANEFLVKRVAALEAENRTLREGLEDLRCTGHKNGWIFGDVQCVAGPAPNRCIQIRRLLRSGGGTDVDKGHEMPPMIDDPHGGRGPAGW